MTWLQPQPHRLAALGQGVRPRLRLWHSLLRDAVLVLLPGTSHGMNLISGIPSSTRAPVAGGPGGAAAMGDGAYTYTYPSARYLTDATALSVFAVFAAIGAAAWTGITLFRQRTGGGAGPTLGLWRHASDQYSVSFNGGDLSGSWPLTRPYNTFGGVFTSANQCWTWADGVPWHVAASCTWSTLSSSQDALVIQNAAANWRLLYLVVWRRAVLEAEMRALHTDPAQICEPEPLAIWVGTAAGGAAASLPPYSPIRAMQHLLVR